PHDLESRLVLRNGVLEILSVRLHKTRCTEPEARLLLQRGKCALALDRHDKVSMIVVGVDLKRHQLAVRGQHRVHREQEFTDSTRLYVADLHLFGAYLPD